MAELMTLENFFKKEREKKLEKLAKGANLNDVFQFQGTINQIEDVKNVPGNQRIGDVRIVLEKGMVKEGLNFVRSFLGDLLKKEGSILWFICGVVVAVVCVWLGARLKEGDKEGSKQVEKQIRKQSEWRCVGYWAKVVNGKVVERRWFYARK